jgi:gamma-glutamylcyclotransferase (GGCT)/AIG2-like uncharacterized protein YtfP
VYTANENEIAWIYWFNEPIKDQPIIPSGDMLEYMRQQKKLG